MDLESPNAQADFWKKELSELLLDLEEKLLEVEQREAELQEQQLSLIVEKMLNRTKRSRKVLRPIECTYMRRQRRDSAAKN
jgi:hypothetical protein